MLKPPPESVQHIEHVEHLICQSKRGRYYINGPVTLTGDDQGPIDLSHELRAVRYELSTLREELLVELTKAMIAFCNGHPRGLVPSPAPVAAASLPEDPDTGVDCADPQEPSSVAETGADCDCDFDCDFDCDTPIFLGTVRITHRYIDGPLDVDVLLEQDSLDLGPFCLDIAQTRRLATLLRVALSLFPAAAAGCSEGGTTPSTPPSLPLGEAFCNHVSQPHLQ